MHKATLAALALSASLVGLSAVALPTVAEARPFFFLEHRMARPFFFNHLFFGPRIFLGPRVVFDRPCSGLLYRAEITGSRFWWREYEECRAGF